MKKYCVEVGEFGVMYFDTKEQRDFWATGYFACRRNHPEFSDLNYELNEFEQEIME
jgi:hypothetical protein